MSGRAEESAALVAAQLDALPGATPDVVRLLGRAARLAPGLRAPGREVQAGALPSEAPSPDVAVVWLDDLESPPAERSGLLTSALAALPASGRLVVVATVVGTGPAFDVLHDELVWASGAMVHLDVVASVRWAGEQQTRGVVLVATSLGPRDGL